MAHEAEVYVDLDEKQAAMLAPLIAKLQEAYDQGKPCAILGQPASNGSFVMFKVLTHEQTLAVQEIVAPRRRAADKEADWVTVSI